MNNGFETNKQGFQILKLNLEILQWNYYYFILKWNFWGKKSQKIFLDAMFVNKNRNYTDKFNGSPNKCMSHVASLYVALLQIFYNAH